MAHVKGTRMLLVEDNEMNQELAVALLRQAGVDVVIAGNGQEALDTLARDSQFDCVLMDCQMPVMDGYTATRELRKNPAFKELPIVAMTANAMAGDREKVIEAGMWDHIAKPLNVGDMFATIAKWIKRSGAAPGASQEGTHDTAAGDSVLAAEGLVGLNASLPGIDVNAGLATTMQDAKLYTRLLVKFREGQGDFANLFASARTDADPAAAARAAHTLKGTAGNIGAKQVQAAADALEQACLANAPRGEVDQLLEQTLEVLAPVMVGLIGVGAPTAQTAETARGEAPAVDEAQWLEARSRLVKLLEESDADAGDALDALAELAKGTPLAETLRRVAAAVDAFDFDAALKILEQG
jgi:two-component system, sensor histidine kinase and response regulator